MNSPARMIIAMLVVMLFGLVIGVIGRTEPRSEGVMVIGGLMIWLGLLAIPACAIWWALS